jgi:hypothetical protein
MNPHPRYTLSWCLRVARLSLTTASATTAYSVGWVARIMTPAGCRVARATVGAGVAAIGRGSHRFLSDSIRKRRFLCGMPRGLSAGNLFGVARN